MTRLVVPFMGIVYMLGTLAVLLVHWKNIPMAVGGILTAAFSPRAVSGGLFGQVTLSAFQSLRWGVSRGIFPMKRAWERRVSPRQRRTQRIM